MTPIIELTRGQVTTNENGITAKSGKYNITANYAKHGDGKFITIGVVAEWEKSSARMEQYGDKQQISYSMPDGLTESDKSDVIAILDDVFTQIKTF